MQLTLRCDFDSSILKTKSFPFGLIKMCKITKLKTVKI